MAAKYGFRCNKNGNQAFVYTAPEGTVSGRDRSVGMFHYENNDFKTLELRPVTGIIDRWQSERERAAEAHICEKAILDVGKRVGQFQIKVVKRVFRDAGSHAERYVIVITEHLFFTELYNLLEDSSMTDEEVINNVEQIETLIDKYKDTL